MTNCASTADRIDDYRVSDKLAWFADDLELVADAVRTGTTRQVLRVISDTVGLGRALTLLDSSKGGHGDSQVDDLDALIQVSDLHPDPATFESWLRRVLDRRGDDRGVMLSTVHRVKGMEWDRVIVAGVTEGVFPHRLAEDREEERRVMHVAITRCRQRVVVLADASRPSSFLRELHHAATAVLQLAARSPRRARRRRARRPIHRTTCRRRLPESMEALRAWRRQRSQADKVRAYVVASDALLRSIALALSQTLEELAAIKGIGPKKLQLYGRRSSPSCTLPPKHPHGVTSMASESNHGCTATRRRRDIQHCPRRSNPRRCTRRICGWWTRIALSTGTAEGTSSLGAHTYAKLVDISTSTLCIYHPRVVHLWLQDQRRTR